MRMFFDEEEDFSPKLLETKLFIRVNEEGELQVVRITPVMNELGMFNADKVAMYIDEGQATFVSRESLSHMLEASACIAIEHATNWKHKEVH